MAGRRYRNNKKDAPKSHPCKMTESWAAWSIVSDCLPRRRLSVLKEDDEPLAGMHCPVIEGLAFICEKGEHCAGDGATMADDKHTAFALASHLADAAGDAFGKG